LLAAKDAELESLLITRQAELVGKDEVIQRLSVSFQEIAKAHVAVQEELAAKDRELAGTKQELSAKDTELVGVEEDVERAREERTRQEASLAAKDKQLAREREERTTVLQGQEEGTRILLAGKDAELAGKDEVIQRLSVSFQEIAEAHIAVQKELERALARGTLLIRKLAARDQALADREEGFARERKDQARKWRVMLWRVIAEEGESARAALAARDEAFELEKNTMEEERGRACGMLAVKEKELADKITELAARGRQGTEQAGKMREKEELVRRGARNIAAKDKELAGTKEELAAKEGELAGQEAALAARNQELAGKEEELKGKEGELAGKEEEIARAREEHARALWEMEERARVATDGESKRLRTTQVDLRA